MLGAWQARVVGLCVLGATLGFGCGDDLDGEGQTVKALYEVPADLSMLADATFFEHPFPSELRVKEGRVRMLGYPNPKSVPLLDEYIGFIDDKLSGFSPVAAGFMRFDGAIDAATLPGPLESTLPNASVQLIDVDPDSPARGSRVPLYLTFRAEEGVYWQPNTLAFMPVPGHVLSFSNRYALVVTDSLAAAGGGKVVQAETLTQTLGLAAASSDAVADLASRVAADVAAVREAGIEPERVVHFTSFATGDPTREFLDAARAANEQPTPVADPNAWVLDASNNDFDEYYGSYGPVPSYQTGTSPFNSFGDGGGFAPDASGVPQPVSSYDARFALVVPNQNACPLPPNGYPIVLYAHGTGGNYRSFVSDGTARALARQCLASMGVDQIFHGTYPGAPADSTKLEILFFNFNNIEAARTNIRQSGLDEVHRARLFSEGGVSIPASVSATGVAVSFDAEKLTFFGHSQGSLNGPLFLAGSDLSRGAVLSGASGLIQITLLEKTEPQPSVAFLVKAIFLQLVEDEQAEVSLLYPPVALAQTIVDPVDPINYARQIFLQPAGQRAKSVYMTEGVGPDGVGDAYAPPRGCEALGRAMGLPLMNPVVWTPVDDVGGEFERVSIDNGGLSGNLAGGQASGVLAQWDPGNGEGHFVVFDVDAAKAQAAGFLRALSDDPIGRVPAP